MRCPGYPQVLSTQWKTYTGVIFEYQPCIFEAEHPPLPLITGRSSNLTEHRINLIRISPDLSPPVDNFFVLKWKTGVHAL